MTTETVTSNGTTMHATPAAIVRHEEATIQPANFSELRALAKDAAATRFYGAASPEQAFLLMMTGKDLGLSYTQALRAFHVIEGRPALSADGMVAVCLSHPDVCEYFRTVEASPTRATVATKRAGSPERTQTFTIEEAQAAGLVKEKSGWAKWPARMCLARARSFLARDVYPDLLMGLYDPDELRDAASVEGPRPVRAEVVSPPAPSSPAIVESQDDTIAVADAFAQKIAEAGSQKDLDAAARLLVKAQRDGQVTEAQFMALGERIKARRGEVGK